MAESKAWYGLNGDDPKRVTEDYIGLAEAIRTVQEKLKAVCPHGRNFSTPEDYREAHAVWTRWAMNVENVREGVELEMMNAANQAGLF
jgi:DNA-binding IscR family transcriptional regulator